MSSDARKALTELMKECSTDGFLLLPKGEGSDGAAMPSRATVYPPCQSPRHHATQSERETI